MATLHLEAKHNWSKTMQTRPGGGVYKSSSCQHLQDALHREVLLEFLEKKRRGLVVVVVDVHVKNDTHKRHLAHKYPAYHPSPRLRHHGSAERKFLRLLVGAPLHRTNNNGFVADKICTFGFQKSSTDKITGLGESQMKRMCCVRSIEPGSTYALRALTYPRLFNQMCSSTHNGRESIAPTPRLVHLVTRPLASAFDKKHLYCTSRSNMRVVQAGWMHHTIRTR